MKTDHSRVESSPIPPHLNRTSSKRGAQATESQVDISALAHISKARGAGPGFPDGNKHTNNDNNDNNNNNQTKNK